MASGQALAIFETKVLADYALEAMEMKCLVVTDSKRLTNTFKYILAD